MTGVPPLSKSIGWTRGIFDGRAQMFDLQRQFATGQKSATYGGLGPDRTLSIAMRSRLSAIEAFSANIQTIGIRLDVLTTTINRFADIGREVKADAVFPSYDLVDGGRTGVQVRAETALDEALALLRADVAGRYLFSGRAVDTPAVESMSAILDGAGGRAGFRQHLDERRQADLGLDGMGRLVLDPPAADEVTISEDFDGSPFGFKITALTTGIAGATANGPAGSPPEASISFSGASPQPGDTVRLTLAMPGGGETDIVLRAAVPGQAGEGAFEIGATDEETAANFHAALVQAVGREAQTTLSAASALAAGEDFFNFDADHPPRRIDGDPPGSATALRDATPQDTVFWYRGDAGTDDPRHTAVARVDDAISVSYGARANEEAFRWTIQNLAVLASETFDGAVPEDKLRYEALTQKVASNLAHAEGRQSPDAVHAQMASAQHAMGKAVERHKMTKAMAADVIGKVEEADPNEVAVKLLQLQTRLTATYEVTAMLSRLSLVYVL